FHSASEILANARDHIINRISNRNVDSCKQSNAPQNLSKDEQWAVKVLMDLKVGDLTEDPNEQSKVAKTDNNSPYHSEHIIGKAGHTEVLGECHDTHH
ncbi:MAG: hypothetical protein KA998_04405, partial [Rickettsiaceae bacterium]|nr:hypothetical protein [Rickettsiaceae bacterium]